MTLTVPPGLLRCKRITLEPGVSFNKQSIPSSKPTQTLHETHLMYGGSKSKPPHFCHYGIKYWPIRPIKVILLTRIEMKLQRNAIHTPDASLHCTTVWNIIVKSQGSVATLMRFGGSPLITLSQWVYRWNLKVGRLIFDQEVMNYEIGGLLSMNRLIQKRSVAKHAQIGRI